MVLGDKTQSTNLENLERGSVHELWIGGTTADRVFTALEGYPRALRVDVLGILKIEDHTGAPVQIPYNVIQGEILPFAVSKLVTTGSTATVQIWW